MRPSEESVPNNILIKVFKENPEKKLQDALYQKYGKRFLEYRENYKKTISDDDHKYYFNVSMIFLAYLDFVPFEFHVLGSKQQTGLLQILIYLIALNFKTIIWFLIKVNWVDN